MTAAGVTHRYERSAVWRRSKFVPSPAALRVTPVTFAALAGLAGLHLLTGLLFITGTASGEAAGWNRLPIDDAWTRITYIRNFSDSFSLEFSRGVASTGATSPLWVVLNGLTAALFGLSDSALPGLAKAFGILFGLASVWMVFRITWQITRKRYFGLIAGAVLAVEPNFGYATVSGTEVTLFAAMSLAAAWAYYRGRIRTSGIFAALAIAARPEGVLLALLIVGSTLARWTWRRYGPLIQRRRDIHDLAFLAGPSLAVVLAWVVYNWSVTGNALPDSYLAINESLSLLPLSNLWNIWMGYLHELPFMDGLAWVVGLPLVILGIYSIIARHSFSAAPLALFALAMVYAAMITFIRPDSAWMFEDRRHMDPAAPFTVILLAVGLARAWQLVRAWQMGREPRSDRERRAVVITARVAAAALLIAPLAALPVKWNSLTTEYSWNSRNTSDVQVSMGRWLDENTPGNAVIGAIPAGAISFFAGHEDRKILDLAGKNTHDAQGVPPLGYGLEQEVDYLVAFREPFFDSIPGRAVVNEERVSFANPFHSNVMRAYGPPGSLVMDEVRRDDFAYFEPQGLTLIDRVDVGNGSAPLIASEAAHDYSLVGEISAASFTMSVSEGAVLTDDSRSFRVAEEFTVASQPGQPLTIVKRYETAASGSLRVVVDGVEAGVWELPSERTFFSEAAFIVPPELVTGSRTRLRFEVIPGQDSVAATSFHYWILVPGTVAVIGPP